MTPREIIYANLEHNNPERIGLNFSDIDNKDWLYPNPPTGSEPIKRINDIYCLGPDQSQQYKQNRWVKEDKEFYDDEWGNIWFRMIDGCASGEILTPALKDWSQLKNLKLPDFDNPRRYDNVRRQFADKKDKFKLGAMPCWVFATSRYLRKMEIYFCDLIEYRQEIDKLHCIVTELCIKVMHQFAKAGADGIFYCEDLGIQDRLLISPPMWRDIFKPHYDRLVSTAHELGLKVLMHSCGYNCDLIDDLAQTGIDCFQFDQPAVYDMPELAKKLKKYKIALWSPVDIQQVLPTGDKNFIEAETKKLTDIFGGFLIMKNYPDLHGIGVKPQWDMWAYEAVLQACGLNPS